MKGVNTEDILNLNKGSTSFLSTLYSKKQSEKINYIFNTIFTQDKYKQLIKHSSIYLCLHADEDKDEELLFVLETSRNYNNLLLDFFDSLCISFDEKSFVYKNNTIHSLSIDHEFLYLNHQNGLLLMTFSENLMRQAMNKFLQHNEGLQSVNNLIKNKKDKNAKIHLYVQYKYFIPYFKNEIRKIGGDIVVIDMFQSCQWSVLDLNIKKQDILLSGYTTINTSMMQSKLLIHKNNRLDFIKLLPDKANRVISVKANNANDWKSIKPVILPQEDVFLFMYPAQIVNFELENDTAIFNYLLIKSENISEASLYLFNSIRTSSIDNYYMMDTLYIGSSFIGHINLPNFVFTKLGINSHLPYLKYYTLIDDYIVFTDSKESILSYIEHVRYNKTLNTSKEYQALQNYFTNEANVFYYYNSSDKKKENSFMDYGENLQLMRMQLYVQSDSILSTNIAIRVK